MAGENRMVFYDIASDEPLRTFAPNPWKTRLALNYKCLPYRTEWVHMPDIRQLRESLGVPANRTSPDGSPYHTLPLLHDPKTGKYVGDSFEIAQYLDAQYPDTPRLFRPNTVGLTAGWNFHIDTLFTRYTPLCGEMPFDPKHKEKIYSMFASRMATMKEPPANSVADPTKAMSEFETALGELLKSFRHTGGTTDRYFRPGGTAEAEVQCAPKGREGKVWLDGDEPVYADFIVGAWLKMFEASMKAEDWQEVRKWQGGFWGSLVDALEPWTQIK